MSGAKKSDDTCMTLIKALQVNLGDSKKWDEFYQRYRRLIMSMAERKGFNHYDAEDVCQNVFIKVARAIDRFDPKRTDPVTGERYRFRSWLCTITYRCIVDRREVNKPSAPITAIRSGEPQTEGGRPIQVPISVELARTHKKSRIEAAKNAALKPGATPGQKKVVKSPREPKPSKEFLQMWQEEWWNFIQARTLERLKEEVNSNHYQVFVLHYIEEKPIEDVCRTMNMKRDAVYQANKRVLARFGEIGKIVKKEEDTPHFGAKIQR